jgi:hypothetical protein
MNESSKVNGSCFCGAVRFHLELPSKWCAHCHCSMCRKVHGAGYVTWVGFEQSKYRLDEGENELTWFKSSSGASRGFCQKCGSSMFFKADRWVGELHVTLASLDDPIDRKPQAHAYHDSHVDWMPLDDALKVFNG